MNARFANLFAVAIVVAALTAPARPARADNWTVTLDDADQVASPGVTVVYTGVITNGTGAPLSLDASLDFLTSPDAEQFTIDFADELLALDLVIPVGGYAGPIFEVSWTNDATLGTFGSGGVTLAAGLQAEPAVRVAVFTLGTPGVGPFCGFGTGFVGAGNAIAANDSTGNPVIVYNNPADGSLRYAMFDGSGWITTPIATGVGGQASPSLVMDGDVHPHVTFYDVVAGDLVHAWNPGTGWQLERVDTTGNVGSQPSLAIDAIGELHVSYRDVTNGNLRYAHQTDGAWSASSVDTVGDVGAYSSITTDQLGGAYISYHDATAGDLKLAWSTGGAWSNDVVDAAGTTGTWTSIRQAGGTISISYRDATSGSEALKFARGVPDSWTVEAVDSLSDAGRGSSLELNGFGQPRIAYFEATSSEVRYAARTGSGWAIQPVTTGGTDLISLALNANEEPFLSYVDGVTGELRFAAVTTCGPLSVPQHPRAGAPQLVLHAHWPNPFSASTTLSFTVSRASEVRVRVFDAAGRLVAEPFRRTVAAGKHDVTWNGTSRSGARLAPGRYLYEVRSGAERRVGRLALVR